jgi:hypothetical protein
MLNEMERRALEMLLAGDNDELAIYRAQLNAATVASRKVTGVGFFTQLSVPAELPRVKNRARLVVGDLYAEVSGLEHEAGFLLFIEDGAIDILECFIVDDHWPDNAALRRLYYVRSAAPGSSSVVETKERDIEYALRHAV